MRKRMVLLAALVVALVAVQPAMAIGPLAGTTTKPAVPLASTPEELQPLLLATRGNLAVGRYPGTGQYGMVRATNGAVLAPGSAAAPEQTARTFLAEHGHLAGMSAAEMAYAARIPAAGAPAFDGGSELVLTTVETDRTTGLTRVDLDQRFAGHPVVGGRLTVSIGSKGVTSLSGVFVPRISVARPAFDAAAAGAIAKDAVAAKFPGEALEIHQTVVEIWTPGLVDRRPTASHLAFAVDVEGAEDGHVGEQVVVDAATGAVLARMPLHLDVKDRCVYTPAYVNPNNDESLAVRREGEPETNVPPLDNLYDYSGQVYDFFSDVFGRDSWDGQGHKMRTVYDFTATCPNAYWDGTQKITRYCPGFDLDDVVAHEWGHAYTQATHGLIYMNQPGALNESYSDIWGEVVDLTNGEDGIGGSDNVNHSANGGQRWVVGEDLSEAGKAIGLRDMYNPESRNQPSKVTSKTYICGTGDYGGVHTNSAVPNHAFAMLVDGKTFNGHTVGAIGMTKASHIYYQAMTAYQTPTSGFGEHAEALRAGCADLLGITLNPIPGDAAGQAITAADCAQVEEAIAATEMDDPPVLCGGPLLAQAAPAACPGGSAVFFEDWETGTDGWTFAATPANAGPWAGTQFAATSTLPDGRTGTAVFAEHSRASACPTATVQGNAVNPSTKPSPAGTTSVTSPAITATTGVLTLRFDHWVATEAKDGGNVLVSVNGGTFAPVPTTAYTYNPPTVTLPTANPKKTQVAWSGTDTGLLEGTWGTSIADLSSLVDAGDTFVLRFESGQDCGGGITGWYVDDITVLSCPSVAPPVLSLGADYGAPDADGSYTLSWARPADATGPDVVEEAVLSTIFSDDAESGLDRWISTTEGTGAFDWRQSPKPGHVGMTFYAQGNEATTGTSSILTSREAVAIPAIGSTQLTFAEFSYNHAGDKTVVEVSEDGVEWTQVYTRSTPSVIGGEAGVADPLAHRSVSLDAFAGRSVHLRFRFTQGAELYVDVTRFGWYVDDIAVSTYSFATVAETTATELTRTGQAPGTYLYRVSTTYGTRPSALSNVVRADVVA